jgi:hypothetical protein
LNSPPNEPDWKAYERQIYERLRTKADGAEVTFDEDGRQTLPGLFSAIDRQIDVIVRGRFPTMDKDVQLVVDCKCFSEKIDVGHVDGFLGLMQDVHRPLGLMITTIGFSAAASRRATSHPGVSLDVVEFDRLARWRARVPTISHTTGTNTVVLTQTNADGRTWVETVTLEEAHGLMEHWGRDSAWLPKASVYRS